MNFNQKVYNIVKKIPKGKVATYGQIAALAGSPRAARQVGWALHQLETISKLPWHRVINKQGMISTTCEIHTAKIQKQMLEKENITITEKQGMYYVDLNKYLWN